MQGRDLLVVVSDSGKLSFLRFCNEMHRFSIFLPYSFFNSERIGWASAWALLFPMLILDNMLPFLMDYLTSLYTVCWARFFPVTHVQLSSPGNLRNQLGQMLAIDSK